MGKTINTKYCRNYCSLVHSIQYSALPACQPGSRSRPDTRNHNIETQYFASYSYCTALGIDILHVVVAPPPSVMYCVDICTHVSTTSCHVGDLHHPTIPPLHHSSCPHTHSVALVSRHAHPYIHIHTFTPHITTTTALELSMYGGVSTTYSGVYRCRQESDLI